MSHPPSGETKYFLGIEGEQSGPFTEAEVILKIRQGVANLDSLVWYEGLQDWKSLSNVEIFRLVLENPGDPIAKDEDMAPAPLPESYKSIPEHAADSIVPAATSASAPRPAVHKPSTFAADSSQLAPIFDAEDAALQETPFVRFRFVFISTGLLVMALVTGAYIFLKIQTTETAKKIVRPKVRSESISARMNAMKTAEASLDIEPEKAVSALSDLIKQDSTDTIGQKAAEIIVTHYRRQQRTHEAADILMSVKQYERAAKLYMTEPVNRQKAEKALSLLLETEKGPRKKDILIDYISIALGSGGDHKKAMAALEILSKEFPNEPHPFGYYLRPLDQRIADVFSRISYYYMNGLISAIATQLPAITLVGKPIVQIRKGRGKYRIVGEYNGEILFNNDRVNKMHFLYWFVDDDWSLVETNLTKERAQWAAAAKARLAHSMMEGPALIQALETRFATEFPKQTLYDPVPFRMNATETKK